MGFVRLFTILSIFALEVSTHLVLNIPEVWGITNAVSLEQPMDSTTSNFICAGKQPLTSSNIKFIAGNSYNFNTMCGELNLSSEGCLIGDWHQGANADDYSGCVLGIANQDYTQRVNHKFLAHSTMCPKRGSPVSFTIPANTPECTNCVCSWGWVPSRKYSSPAQFYHNCFYCDVKSNVVGSRIGMRQYEFINAVGSSFADITYNEFFEKTGKLEVSNVSRILKTKQNKKIKKIKKIYKVRYMNSI